MAVGAPSGQCGLRCSDPQSRSNQTADQTLRVMEHDSPGGDALIHRFESFLYVYHLLLGWKPLVGLLYPRRASIMMVKR